MAGIVDYYARALDGFTQRVDATKPDQWGASTPCRDWDVGALVAHVLDEQLWVPPLLAGETVEQVGDRFKGDQRGDDASISWARAAEAALEAASGSTALDGRVQLSYGEERAETYLWQVTSDTLIHTWDLARGIGDSERLDPETVHAVSDFLAPQAESWRAAGAFDAAIPVGASADPQTVLLAMTGRSA
jgi:uncharacterized protein (TIGR03086 family)